MHGPHRTLKRFFAGGIVWIVCIAAASPAAAAITVGSPLAVNADLTAEPCGGVILRCAVVNPAAMPANGILTKVRIRGAATDTVVLRIVRPTGPDSFMSAASNRVASGAPLAFRLKAGESTFNVRLPVLAGDLLALEGSGLAEALGPVDSGSAFGVSFSGDTDGATGVKEFDVDAELLVQGTLEADADGDGFGDESQDSCPTLREHQLPCAQLAVTTEAPTTVLPGADVSVAAVVTNRGPGASPATQLRFDTTPAPASAAYVSPAGPCAATCPVPGLAPGASVRIAGTYRSVQASFQLRATVLGPVAPPTWVLLAGFEASGLAAPQVLSEGQLAVTARTKSTRKGPSVRLTCPAAAAIPCTGTVGLSIPARGKTKARSLAAALRFSIPAGQKKSFTVRLSKTGAKLLKRGRKLSAVVTVTRTGIPAGPVVTRSRASLRAR